MDKRNIFKTNGFTMAEIIMVVVITGILAAIALPKYHAYFARVNYGEAIPILNSLRDAQVNYSYENGGNFAESADPINWGLDITISGMRGFKSPAVHNDANQLAEVTETNDKYVLSIAQSGKVTCSAGTAGTVSDCAAAGCRLVGTVYECN
jgi:prepilin-type N-terminal cleavage/methylation domain-containing protein